jgi:hypothetical protein
VTAYAQAALGWRRVDAELAELLADSWLETGTGALARSDEGATRQLSFRAAGLELELELQQVGENIVVLALLAPAVPAVVDVQRDDDRIVAQSTADDLGRVRLELADRGRVRLIVRRAEAPPVQTSWFDI